MNETILGIIAAVAAFVGIVTWANWYAKRRYRFKLCAVCKGSGKEWEPLWLRWLRLGFFRRRRFDNCPAPDCNGGKVTD